VLPGRAVERPPLRRVVHHRGDLDPHLLPAELSRSTADAQEHALLPHRGRGKAGGLPGVQALPPRRRARIPGVEHPRGSRSPRHAPDRRRRRRPRRRGRSGGKPRIQRPPARTAAAGRGRSRSARAGPRAAGPDRAHPRRDDRAAVRRRCLRGRILEHPPVQRHDPRGVRAHSDRAEATGAWGREDHGPRNARAPVAAAHAVLSRQPVRSLGGDGRSRLRGVPSGRLSPRASVAERLGRRRVDAPTRSRRLHADSRRPARSASASAPTGSAPEPSSGQWRGSATGRSR